MDRSSTHKIVRNFPHRNAGLLLPLLFSAALTDHPPPRCAVSELLYAFGDSPQPLSSTASILDEILTDFIIETCHAAALCASYSRRQKIKIDDFRWVLRKSPALLGRVNEQLFREKYIKNQRKIVDFDAYGKEGAQDLADLAEVGGAGEEDMKPDKGKRGRKRRKRKTEDAAPGVSAAKRLAI